MNTRPVGRARSEQAAQQTLEEFGVQEPPVPIEKIVKESGLRVIYEDLPYDTSSVLIRQPDGERVVGVNAKHSPTRRRFSLAHELGHALLHLPAKASDHSDAMVSRPLEILFRDGTAGQGSSRVEIDANVFAAGVLMPKDMVVRRFRDAWRRDANTRVEELIDELAEDFDVSSQAMRYRLVNLGLVDPA